MQLTPLQITTHEILDLVIRHDHKPTFVETHMTVRAEAKHVAQGIWAIVRAPHTPQPSATPITLYSASTQ